MGSGKSFYIRDLIGNLIDESPEAKAKVTLPERLADDELVHVRADISKLVEATGFEPQHDVFETIKDVLEDYRRNN